MEVKNQPRNQIFQMKRIKNPEEQLNKSLDQAEEGKKGTLPG